MELTACVGVPCPSRISPHGDVRKSWKKAMERICVSMSIQPRSQLPGKGRKLRQMGFRVPFLEDLILKLSGSKVYTNKKTQTSFKRHQVSFSLQKLQEPRWAGQAGELIPAPPKPPVCLRKNQGWKSFYIWEQKRSKGARRNKVKGPADTGPQIL